MREKFHKVWKDSRGWMYVVRPPFRRISGVLPKEGRAGLEGREITCG